MGKASNNLNNRMKALALDRKNKKKTKPQNLTIMEEIADCEAKIKLCIMDIQQIGESLVIEKKIENYYDKIVKLEKQLE